MYLGHSGVEQSKIWLGGYDRTVIRDITIRNDPTKASKEFTDDEIDAEIKWLDVIPPYHWTTSLDKAEIGDEDWNIQATSVIYDSGSSFNYLIPRDFNVLMNRITKQVNCFYVVEPQETYLCECSSVNDPRYPTLKLSIGKTKLFFEPKDYLLYGQFKPLSDPVCLLTFQKESLPNTDFWIVGDSFLRAFYAIYDAENRRIGLVGKTEEIPLSEIEAREQ